MRRLVRVMQRKPLMFTHRNLGLLGFVASLVAACSSSSVSGGASSMDGGTDSGSPNNVDGSAAATAPPGGAVVVPNGSGSTLADRLGAAARACGPQSTSTIPGGWEIVAVGDRGCAVWAPSGWIRQGAGTGTVSIFSDSTGVEGFVGIAGATRDLSSCTPEPARTSILGGFAANGYSSPEVVWHIEQNEDFGGSQWNTGHAVFSMTRSTSALAGYLWVLTTPSVIACNVVGLGFWEPEARIEQDTCVLTQILNSVKCPSGGGCDPSECDASCKQSGRSGGTCSSGCECY